MSSPLMDGQIRKIGAGERTERTVRTGVGIRQTAIMIIDKKGDIRAESKEIMQVKGEFAGSLFLYSQN